LILYPIKQEIHNDWFIARKFDKRIEEISSQLLDEISHENLRKAVVTNRESLSPITSTSKFIPYDQFINAGGDGGNHDELILNESSSGCRKSQDYIWGSHLTNFISIKVLCKHGLTGEGDKIIPGSFSHDDDGNDDDGGDRNKLQGHTRTNQEQQQDYESQDGHCLIYPPIPHIDNSNYSQSITSHSGTRRFLATLSPSERTSFFHRQEQEQRQDTNRMVYQKVLSTYYSNNWEILLGEFQLSFVLFLCCSCLTSLEHWYVYSRVFHLISICISLKHISCISLPQERYYTNVDTCATIDYSVSLTIVRTFLEYIEIPII
jgi:hypothetical protein